ncbi:HAMP domain-containing methyl-accepting chemotaxis protein [Salinibius halmophilus]|uniref:HAMP domain-containing methyl-accepting chemotaxis protein n=1 Tax=Salinibius halmophilus TaxID=1853216 RepID=UPI000E6755B8|nr:methyl-accepting chemotaxis protein [Salinibius halmophilus]
MMRLSIVQRVLLGFTALLIAIVVLGGSAYNRLASISAKLSQSYTELMPLLLATQEVPAQLNSLQGLTEDYLLLNDADQLEALKVARDEQAQAAQQLVSQLEQDLQQALGRSVIDFSELNNQLVAAQEASTRLTDFADEARLLDESILLTRTTFYRVWGSLSVDMLRLQQNADRGVARRIRAFDRAGAPVLELFDEAIAAIDRETFERALANLQNALTTMDGLVEQIKEDDERAATAVGSYRDRLRSYMEGGGSLLDMLNQRATVTEQLQAAEADYESITQEISERLDEVVLAVQRFTETEQSSASQLVVGANTLIVTMMIAAVLFASLIGFGLVRSIRRSTEATSTVLEKIAEGNFTVSVDTSRKDEFAKLGMVVNGLTEKLARSIAKVAEVAETLQRSAQQSLRMADETKTDTHEQKLQAQSIATAINELESTVAEIANASNEARTLVTTMGEFAGEGQRSMSANARTIGELDEQVASANKVMEELTGHSQQITSVLDVISAIAEQTNLLALNAAIEAARAGESGRGFAVVADEVRSLADKTRQSTVEIKTMIDKLVDSSQQVSKIMDVASEQMQQCVAQTEETQGAIEKISNAVGQVENMSHQIAEAANQQTLAVQEISHNVVQVAELADRSASRADDGMHGSEQVQSLANEQKQLVSQFKYD